MPLENFVSLIIPVFNEEGIIEASLQNKIDLLQHIPFNSEIIVVDDGSSDNTFKLIRNLNKQQHGKTKVTVLQNITNQGFGGAVSNGIKSATGNVIVCLPVDIHPSVDKFNEIISALSQSDVVVCYRTSKPGNSAFSLIGSNIYQGMVKFLFDLKVKDVNWVHAYKVDVFGPNGIIVRNKKIFFLAEVLIKSKWKNYRIVEIALNPQERLNKKGSSQSFKTFGIAMKDLAAFFFKFLLRGKRGDL